MIDTLTSFFFCCIELIYYFQRDDSSAEIRILIFSGTTNFTLIFHGLFGFLYRFQMAQLMFSP